MKNKKSNKIKVGIVGGSGYVAGELLRSLIHHPNTEIDFVYSHSHSGKKISEIHTDLFVSDLVFSQKVNSEIDIVFLCLGHGNSTRFLLENEFSQTTKIIDLSNDFRLNKDKILKLKNTRQNQEKELEFVYGLPEIYAQKIKESNYIANPGCFATAIQLGTLPLTADFPTIKEWHVHALTGSTGAGQSLSETTHFSWRNENLSVYKPFVHQHLGEIHQSLKDVSQNFEGQINFIPMRGNFTRGIFATMYTNLESNNLENMSEEEIISSYKNFYKDAPFVKISDKPIDLKQVVNTNYCLLHIQKIENKILVTSCIDNLVKGAAGQAIQNMNLQFGLPQETGLTFKANYF
ncbi:N-acetyl-gamma-glutamyl-phosphate reductase [Bernardetia litoralis DSM 6794]|uniref:N-acetyl-gamma-glutamyl-phosphate reductase n=1 Tax=Bernardetia litoralis (strain ATCC 23117 / DSM 6794 / NBRC 15988 / NCIMB 1366 / Fx l1 / Sio-4) TaxID=880071 RepID=I4AQY3_BERLS|nr:N-acetyl-gamma-glutamyl-phosphate reductase [Bernardetia litoralis]AFM06368.1 N-acetyl-gamma-glutamyl-phosphate reductase [Bernardetia litoralis DSM 6794]